MFERYYESMDFRSEKKQCTGCVYYDACVEFECPNFKIYGTLKRLRDHVNNSGAKNKAPNKTSKKRRVTSVAKKATSVTKKPLSAPRQGTAGSGAITQRDPEFLQMKANFPEYAGSKERGFNIVNTVGQNISKKIKERNISRNGLCAIVGIAEGTMTLYLAGKAFPRPAYLDKLAVFFNCSVQDFFEGV